MTLVESRETLTGRCVKSGVAKVLQCVVVTSQDPKFKCGAKGGDAAGSYRKASRSILPRYLHNPMRLLYLCLERMLRKFGTVVLR